MRLLQAAALLALVGILAAACGAGDDAVGPAEPAEVPAVPAPADDAAEAPALEPPSPSPLRVTAIQVPVVSTYVVEAGDTLGAIAAQTGVTIESLIQANDIDDPNMLFVGQAIRVIDSGGPTIIPDGPLPDALVRAEVISVVDGDTIRVRLPDGSEEAVRYIGIDAPEEAGAGAPAQPSAAAATAKNADLVAGGVVFLEADTSNRDAFNRLLRYVWVEEANLRYTFVNGALVAAGLARVSTVPPDARHADLFAELQEFAQVAGVGLWGDVATPAPTPTPEATDEPDGAPTAP